MLAEIANSERGGRTIFSRRYFKQEMYPDRGYWAPSIKALPAGVLLGRWRPQERKSMRCRRTMVSGTR